MKLYILAATVLLSGTATAQPKFSCTKTTAELELKAQRLMTQSHNDVKNMVSTLTKKLKSGELDSLKGACREWHAAQSAADDAKSEEDIKALRPLASQKANDLRALIQKVFYRDRAMWEEHQAAMEKRGYEMRATMNFQVKLRKDLVKPEQNQGIQMIEMTWEPCTPAQNDLGKIDGVFRVAEKSDARLYATERLSTKQFADAHLSAECPAGTVEEAKFLHQQGILQGREKTVSPKQSAVIH
jgi:hypothetical protein